MALQCHHPILLLPCPASIQHNPSFVILKNRILHLIKINRYAIGCHCTDGFGDMAKYCQIFDKLCLIVLGELGNLKVFMLAKWIKSPFLHKTLFWGFVNQEIKGRYAGSMGGLLWSIVTPLANLLIFIFVFSVVFRDLPQAGGNRYGQFCNVSGFLDCCPGLHPVTAPPAPACSRESPI